MKLEHTTLPATFTNVYEKVSTTFELFEEYDLTADPKTYMDEIKKVFEMVPLDDATIEEALSGGISQFSLSDVLRSPEEQETCRLLSEQAQDCFVSEMIRYERTFAELKAAVGRDAAMNLKRLKPFLRQGGTNEDLQFNKEFLAACSDTKTLAQAQFNEVMKTFKEFGIKSPKDFAALYELSNEDFLKKYAQISRMTRMAAELQTFRDTNDLTEEQRAVFLPYLDLAIGFTPIMEHRLSLMANPLYSRLDSEQLYEKTRSHAGFENKMEALEETVNFGKNHPTRHPLGAMFASLGQLQQSNSISVQDRALVLYPELKGAAFSTDNFAASLQASQPVVAHTRDGQAMVLTNALNVKPLTVREVSKQLTDEALQADKFLLTGSKQFANMLKLKQEFDELQNSQLKTTESQLAKSNELVVAAEQYLEHKGLLDLVKKGVDSDTLLHKGKNKREQSRLEVALKILQFHKAESASLEKVPAMEEAMEAEAKIDRPSKVRASLTTTAGKNDVPKLVSDLLGRAGPQTEVDGKKVNIIPQRDIAILYALACGSDKVYYKIANSKSTSKDDIKTYTNKNPEETYRAMLQGVCNGQNISEFKNVMVMASMSRIFHSLNSGNYKELGQLVADGLKTNNKMMEDLGSYSPEFFVCAKLGEQFLDMMQRYPVIKKAVSPHLTEGDLQAAKTGVAISELHDKGTQALTRLNRRFRMQDKEQAFRGIEEDLAYLSQMHGVEKQLAGHKLKMATDNYGKIENYSHHLNKGLAGNEPMTGFIKELYDLPTKDQIAKVNDPKKMTDIYDKGIENVRNAQKQQTQPALTLKVVQNKPKTMEQGKGMA